MNGISFAPFPPFMYSTCKIESTHWKVDIYVVLHSFTVSNRYYIMNFVVIKTGKLSLKMKPIGYHNKIYLISIYHTSE